MKNAQYNEKIVTYDIRRSTGTIASVPFPQVVIITAQCERSGLAQAHNKTVHKNIAAAADEIGREAYAQTALLVLVVNTQAHIRTSLYDLAG